MRKLFGVSALFFGLVFSSTPAHSTENFYNNQTTIYPSGCATLLQMGPDFHGETEEIISKDTLYLWDSDSVVRLPVDVIVYRMGCQEENRSAIIVRVGVQPVDDGQQSFVRVPFAFGEIDGVVYPLRLATEPNSHLPANAASMGEGQIINYYLDGRAFGQSDFGFDNWMLPEQYNNGFTLHLVDPRGFAGIFNYYSHYVPPYFDELKSETMPINGRLSGAWVTPGAEDQGFLISFNELFSSNGLLSMVFLSWYTFDQEGNPMWLVGNALYNPGDDSVEFEVTLVENGQFLGPKKADRTNVGTIKLTAKSCTEIQTNYDLAGLSMGSGNFLLTRVFDMETAGYACQDLGNRLMQ